MAGGSNPSPRSPSRAALKPQALAASAASFAPDRADLAALIDAALPQTQCTRCGFPDCAAYAEAIAHAGAAINQCPPGGAEGIRRLAEITGTPALPLDPDHGIEGPRAVAVIDEAWCIGCTLCLDACPTDAILGSNKMMHTVIEPHCTGCELCIPVCPVDCISLENVTGDQTGWAAWSQAQADEARRRYKIHSARRSDSLGEGPKTVLKTAFSANFAAEPPTLESAGDASSRKRAVIDAALAKARALRRQPTP
jgi:Na+-translocating ferredoxin:NAD+ oxidoreductase subunit B